MARRAAAALLLLLGGILVVPGAVGAEIFRCEDAAGRLHFTDDPRRCIDAEVHPPDADRVQRLPGRDGPSPTPSRSAAPRASAPETTPRPGAPALSDLLPPTPAGWEATHEAVEVERDPALRARGLRESVARHYGRSDGPVSHLCTVEIWSFTSAGEARDAEGSLAGRRDTTRVVGPYLVLARSVRMERHVGATRVLAPECRALAASVDGVAPRR